MKTLKDRLLAGSIVALSVGLAGPVFASHSWGSYHWATTDNVAKPLLVDNTSADWKNRISLARDDWNGSANVATGFEPNGTNTSRRCSMYTGEIQVCNGSYGYNGWLGIATISVSGDHIVAGSTKLNDSYFGLSTYSSESWKQMVACQEIGHNFGLGHQDENFDNLNLGTCMDYTSDPDGLPSNLHPNTHDYQQLATIYNDHIDSAPPPPDTGGCKGRGCNGKFIADVGNTQAEWGRAIGYDPQGRANVFQQSIRGYTIITHVTWAPDAKRPMNAGHIDGH